MSPPARELAQALARSVTTLVQIPSVNPLHFGPKAAEHGDAGERRMAHHLSDRFDALGASEVVLHELDDGRPNVYGFFVGRGERLVVLDVHSDTVTVEHMTDPPFDGRIEHGHVWGRGALDTKASMGVILALLEQWSESCLRPEPSLLVVGSIGEEAGGLVGATAFRPWAEQRGLEIDQMVVAEPTQLAPIHGHKGGVLMSVTTIGRSAHSALPHLGVNAIDAIAPVLAVLAAEHDRLQTVPPTTELGTGTLTVSQITGGTGGNVVPDRCTISLGRRAVPGEDPDELFEQLSALVRDASPVPVEIASLLPPAPDGKIGSAAFYQSPDSDLVRLLASCAGTQPAVAPFGTNALRYGGFARELAVFGPGSIDDAHQATERVAIADLVKLAGVYERWLNPA